MRNFLTIAFAVATILPGANVKSEDLMPIGNKTERFSVRTDSLWLNVAWSRLIVVATPEHIGHDEEYDCERFVLHVSEFLKGDAGTTNLVFCSSESSFEGDDVESLSKGGRVIAFLSYDGAFATKGKVRYPCNRTQRAIYSYEASFAEMIRREVEEQRKTVAHFTLQKAKLPFWDEVTNLVHKLTVSPAEQAEAVVVLRAHSADFLPAMIAAMDDDRNLADHVLYGGYWTGDLKRHTEKVVDLLATMVSDCTQLDIADMNGYFLSEEERTHCVAVWKVFLDHWLRMSSGGTPLPELEVLSSASPRNQKERVWMGFELPDGVKAMPEEEWTQKLADLKGNGADYVSFELSRGFSSKYKTSIRADEGNFQVVICPDFEKDIDMFTEYVRRKEANGFRYVRECVFTVRKGTKVYAEIEKAIGKIMPWTWEAAMVGAKSHGTKGRFLGHEWDCRFPQTNGTNDIWSSVSNFRVLLIDKLSENRKISDQPNFPSADFRF